MEIKMFPSMRRHLQQLSENRAIDILKKTTNAVLAIKDDVTGYTYAVPVSPVYDNHHLYIHSAPIGQKIAAIKTQPKVSVCVIEKDEIHPETLTSYFRSVIAFGTARLITDPKEKLVVLKKLVDKFAPDFRKEGEAEAQQKVNYVAIIDIKIEHLTGKEAIELVEKH